MYVCMYYNTKIKKENFCKIHNQYMSISIQNQNKE